MYNAQPMIKYFSNIKVYRINPINSIYPINLFNHINSNNPINFYPVKFFAENEQSEFNRGNQPSNRDIPDSRLISRGLTMVDNAIWNQLSYVGL
jgi:hypothetical protein